MTGALCFDPTGVSSPPGLVDGGTTELFFTEGDGVSVMGTVVTSDYTNKIGGEISNVIQGLGATLNMSAFNQILLLLQTVTRSRIAVFTSTSTWTAPSGVTLVRVKLWGGGGGGGGGSIGSFGSGGGGGGYTEGFVAVTPGTPYTVTIGAGGSAGNNSGGNGTAGNQSQFLSLIAAGGAYGSGNSPNGGVGGNASGGTLTFPGEFGQGGFQAQYPAGGKGGNGANIGWGGRYVIAPLNGAINGVPGYTGGGGGSGGAAQSGAGSGATGGAGGAGLAILEF